MKKISILGILLISIASCKKAYKCECITTDSYGGTNLNSREISKTGKKTAEAICGDYTDVYSQTYTGGSSTAYSETTITNCTLK